jgi:hypothetical protein
MGFILSVTCYQIALLCIFALIQAIISTVCETLLQKHSAGKSSSSRVIILVCNLGVQESKFRLYC